MRRRSRSFDMERTSATTPPPPHHQSETEHNSVPMDAAENEEPPPYKQRLNRELQNAFQTGDVSGSSTLAQQITHYSQQLKQQQAAYDAMHQQRVEENKWMNAQMKKVNSIKQVVEEKRRDVEQVELALREYILDTHSRHKGAPSQHTSAAASLGQSILNAFTSSSPPLPQQTQNSQSSVSQPQSMHPCEALIQRALRLIKDTQVVLEQQNLLVDSIDMNDHPSIRCPADVLAASMSPSLLSIKAIRKDCVTYIQSQLQHVDALEKHIRQFEQLLTFLSIRTKPMYEAQPEQQHVHREGQEQKRPASAAGSSSSRSSSSSPYRQSASPNGLHRGHPQRQSRGSRW